MRGQGEWEKSFTSTGGFAIGPGVTSKGFVGSDDQIEFRELLNIPDPVLTMILMNLRKEGRKRKIRRKTVIRRVITRI